jgi:hypothetical protein
MRPRMELMLAAVMALSAACSQHQNYPDGPYPRDDRGRTEERRGWPGRDDYYSPAARALEMRDRLRLDNRQADRLRGIQRTWEERNGTLARRDRGHDADDRRQLAENNDRERREVESVLTRDQRDMFRREAGR